METEELYRKMTEFIELAEIFSHMPAKERTKKKTLEVKNKLQETIDKVKEAVTKEVREIEQNG